MNIQILSFPAQILGLGSGTFKPDIKKTVHVVTLQSTVVLTSDRIQDLRRWPTALLLTPL